MHIDTPCFALFFIFFIADGHRFLSAYLGCLLAGIFRFYYDLYRSLYFCCFLVVVNECGTMYPFFFLLWRERVITEFHSI